MAKKRDVILLVDDDTVDVMAVRRAFRGQGDSYTLNVVSSGEKALDYLKRRGGYADPDVSPRPSIVLLDLSMPGMSGFELLTALKSDSSLKEIPVVVLSASADESDMQTSHAYGAAGYIVKPITFDKFVRTVHESNIHWTLNTIPRSII